MRLSDLQRKREESVEEGPSVKQILFLTLCISVCSWEKKKVTAMPHSMAVWPPPSWILSHCLKTINFSKLHGKQEALTYVLTADGDVESMS